MLESNVGRDCGACDFAGGNAGGGVWIENGQGTKRMTRKTINPDLVPVFTPSLASVLFGCELEKGRPLTEQEVIAIRDQCSTIAINKSEALRLTEHRRLRGR